MPEIADATKDMLLKEIQDRADDNFDLLAKTFKYYRWPSSDRAVRFAGHVINNCLLKLGVDQPALFAKYYPKQMKKLHKKVQAALDKNDVCPYTKIEHGEKAQRSGMYILHHNELAYFVSDPIKRTRNKSLDSRIILPEHLRSQVEYIVVTNGPKPS